MQELYLQTYQPNQNLDAIRSLLHI